MPPSDTGGCLPAVRGREPARSVRRRAAPPESQGRDRSISGRRRDTIGSGAGSDGFVPGRTERSRTRLKGLMVLSWSLGLCPGPTQAVSPASQHRMRSTLGMHQEHPRQAALRSSAWSAPPISQSADRADSPVGRQALRRFRALPPAATLLVNQGPVHRAPIHCCDTAGSVIRGWPRPDAQPLAPRGRVQRRPAGLLGREAQ